MIDKELKTKHETGKPDGKRPPEPPKDKDGKPLPPPDGKRPPEPPKDKDGKPLPPPDGKRMHQPGETAKKA